MCACVCVRVCVCACVCRNLTGGGKLIFRVFEFCRPLERNNKKSAGNCSNVEHRESNNKGLSE